MNFKHSGSLGDIIYSLPYIISQGGGNLYLNPNELGNYYNGCKHVWGKYRMTEEAINFIMPLLNAQPNIKADFIKPDTAIDCNLDAFRYIGINYLYGHIPSYFFWTFKGHYDLTLSWLFGTTKEASFKETIVVNRTGRYHNANINYKFLNDFDDVLFVGKKEEYQDFKKEVSCDYLEFNDAFELANLISGCRLFIGNQSLCFSLAEGLKVPRVLEVCQFAPNVVPMGGKCYAAINQAGFEYGVQAMLTKQVFAGVAITGTCKIG